MEPFIGQIQLFAFNYAPRNWALCDGQIVPIADNNALFALLGTQFGGDGRLTFSLPDLRNKEPDPNTKYYIALEGDFPPRN
jgi:microcystin-dependent protein